jgi:hypothetical protein
MPRAYYQCPACKELFSTKYSGGYNEPPEVQCGNHKDRKVKMTFRGNGWDGRKNLPHGKPPSWEGKECG